MENEEAGEHKREDNDIQMYRTGRQQKSKARLDNKIKGETEHSNSEDHTMTPKCARDKNIEKIVNGMGVEDNRRWS